MPSLFTPYKIRDVEMRNRVWVSPMCQYSSHDGMPTDWHMVHLGSRAVGGAGLVMVEASGVSPVGRISPDDSGIWSKGHAAAFKPITAFIKTHGAVPAIQLAHAGRKAATEAPWNGGGPVAVSDKRFWPVIGASAVPFQPDWQIPHAMSAGDIASVVEEFAAAARHSLEAGFEVVEVHAAHGYLLHSFLSPLANKRSDEYGGSLENRMRFPLAAAEAVRRAWPQHLPVFVRISATDWVEGGWDIAQSVVFAKQLKAIGVDLIDCSSGGIVADAKIPAEPSYQVPFAEAVKREAGIATGAVGLITEAVQADTIIREGKADAVLLARAMLRDPYWPMHAATALDAEIAWPKQYGRGKA